MSITSILVNNLYRATQWTECCVCPCTHTHKKKFTNKANSQKKLYEREQTNILARGIKPSPRYGLHCPCPCPCHIWCLVFRSCCVRPNALRPQRPKTDCRFYFNEQTSSEKKANKRTTVTNWSQKNRLLGWLINGNCVCVCVFFFYFACFFIVPLYCLLFILYISFFLLFLENCLLIMISWYWIKIYRLLAGESNISLPHIGDRSRCREYAMPSGRVATKPTRSIYIRWFLNCCNIRYLMESKHSKLVNRQNQIRYDMTQTIYGPRAI